MSFVKALFDFPSTEQGDLPFAQGDVFLMVRDLDENWAQGTLNGKARI